MDGGVAVFIVEETSSIFELLLNSTYFGLFISQISPIMSMKDFTIPQNFDLEQFFKFFGQISPENRDIIFNALKAIVQPKQSIPPGEFPLKGSVLRYESPFVAIAENEWDALK
jgi:hypothetical protein